MRTTHSWFCLGVTKCQTHLYRPGFLGRQSARQRGTNIFIGLVAKQTSTFFFAELNADNYHQLILNSTGGKKKKKRRGVAFYWPRTLVCVQSGGSWLCPRPLLHIPIPGPWRQRSSGRGAGLSVLSHLTSRGETLTHALDSFGPPYPVPAHKPEFPV